MYDVIKLVSPGVYEHWCPGCKQPHRFNTSSTDHPDKLRWYFNGNYLRPSFTPAMNIQRPDGSRCRYNLHDGWLYYAVESTHALAGHSTPLPP